MNEIWAWSIGGVIPTGETDILWKKCVPLPLRLMCVCVFSPLYASVLYLYPIYTFLSSPFKFLFHPFYLSVISSFLTTCYFHILYIVTVQGNIAQNMQLQSKSLLCVSLLHWFSSSSFWVWAHIHVHLFNLDHSRFVYLAKEHNRKGLWNDLYLHMQTHI